MPINRPRRRFVIGIDPDKNESGFAVWDRQINGWLEYRPLYFYPLQSRCFDFDKDECIFFVEAGWLNKGQNRYQFKKESLPKDWSLWTPVRREAYKFQRGVDVGVNFGAGFAIIHVLRANGYKVETYCPEIAKWSPADLKRYTGITAETNQDVRDALRAAFMNK